MSISARIREARQAAGLTQEGLAEEIRSITGRPSFTRGAISQWEAPNGTAPTPENLAAVAVATNVNFEWIATGRGPRDYVEPPPVMAVQPTGVADSALAGYAVQLGSSTEAALLKEIKKLKPRQRKALAKFIKEFV